jgi:hypothetical protein
MLYNSLMLNVPDEGMSVNINPGLPLNFIPGLYDNKVWTWKY